MDTYYQGAGGTSRAFLHEKRVDKYVTIYYFVTWEKDMYTKLTLNIDESVIENAKIYAKNTKRSVSRLVEEYLYSISVSAKNRDINNKPLGPITRELAGIIKTEKEINHKDLLTEALTEKYL